MLRAMDNPAIVTPDQVRRFIFENQPVRGHWVHLEGAWRELQAHASYPPAVTEPCSFSTSRTSS